MNPTQTPIDTPGQRYCPTESPRVIRERGISCVRPPMKLGQTRGRSYQ
jgi:hypothetical protein